MDHEDTYVMSVACTLVYTCRRNAVQQLKEGDSHYHLRLGHNRLNSILDQIMHCK